MLCVLRFPKLLFILLLIKTRMGTCVLNSPNGNLEQYYRGMFYFVAAIGKGGFGHVWKVKTKKTMEVFALKQMSKARILSLRSLNLVLNQKRLLQKIDHPFIIKMVSSFQDRDNLYLLMEHLSGGDLRYYIINRHRFSENQVKFIIRCVMQALDYLHSKGIIHRDIKPENIVFEKSGYCRITDFGVAKEFRENNARDTSGTLGYMAPQVVHGQKHSYTADYFGVGVVCYELMTGCRPYEGQGKMTIRDQMISKQVQIPQSNKQFSKQMIDFTNRLLQRNPKNRLGAGGIQEITKHDWLRMDDNEHIQFIEKKSKPQFVPGGEKNYARILGEYQETEMDRQNCLLLKQKKFQQLFMDYDSCLIQHRKGSSGSSNETKEVSMTDEKVQMNLLKVAV